jgi:hypothetical protein
MRKTSIPANEDLEIGAGAIMPTTRTPDVLRVDEKNLRDHAVVNVTGILVTSNHRAMPSSCQPVPLPDFRR